MKEYQRIVSRWWMLTGGSHGMSCGIHFKGRSTCWIHFTHRGNTFFIRCSCYCAAYVFVCLFYSCLSGFVRTKSNFGHFEDLFRKWGHFTISHIFKEVLNFVVKVQGLVNALYNFRSHKYRDKNLSMHLHLPVLVLWTLFDSCTCWASDSST